MLLFPLGAGFCAAPVAVLAMRLAGLDFWARVRVDLALIGSAALVPMFPRCRTPPEKRGGTNGLYVLGDAMVPLFLATTGAFALLDGAVLDVVISAGQGIAGYFA